MDDGVFQGGFRISLPATQLASRAVAPGVFPAPSNAEDIWAICDHLEHLAPTSEASGA